jgi:3-deoxy-D-manno-octulosonate 8-phosphate phosphatase (KDO 8-P phosphatase)
MKKSDIYAKAKKIKVIVTDVDGVLTDGFVFINDTKIEPFGKFSIYDGMGVKIAHDCGIKIIVISGRKSLATEARCSKLGIDEAHTGIDDKASKLAEIALRLKLDYSELAYIGDDLIDLKVMSMVGFKVAPQNAVKSVKQRAHYITTKSGGDGVLREVVDLILKAQKRYTAYVKQYL